MVAGAPLSSPPRIVVTPQGKPRRRWVWIPIALASVAAHLVLLLCTAELAGSRATRYGTSQVTVAMVQRTPPATGQRAEPRPKAAPERKRASRVRRAAKPNRQRVPSTPQQPAAPVFGLTGSSLASESELAVRRGNTLDKKMELKPVVPRWATTTLPAPAAPAPPEAPRGPFSLEKLTRRPSFANKVEPGYPEAARERGAEGTVLLRVMLDQRGRVCRVSVVSSPDAALATAAIAALRRSKLTPGYIGRRAVPVVLRIPYRFVLEG
jgi:protein TonB